MNITIIGAGGGIGRMVAQMVVSERLLNFGEKLTLIGKYCPDCIAPDPAASDA